MLKKSLTSLFGGSALLLSSLAFAQGAVTPPTGAEYRTVITLTQKQASNKNINISIASTTIPTAKIGEAYEGFDLTPFVFITGDPDLDVSRVTWSVASGDLPEGVALSRGGQLTGVPVSTQTNQVVLQASYKGKVAQRAFEIKSAPLVLSLSLPSYLPSISAGRWYSYNLGQHLKLDGKAVASEDVSWSLVAGELQPGLELTPEGVVEGFNVSATDKRILTFEATLQDGTTAKRTVTLDFFLLESLPQGAAGLAYRYDLRNLTDFNNLPEDVVWSVVGGELHPGLEITLEGVVEGFNDSATEKRTLTFAATLPNGTVVKRTIQLSFRILDSLPTSSRNIYYEYDVKALSAFKGLAELRDWSITGQHDGLHLTQEGLLAGTTTISGKRTITITAYTPEGTLVKQAATLRFY